MATGCGSTASGASTCRSRSRRIRSRTFFGDAQDGLRRRERDDPAQGNRAAPRRSRQRPRGADRGGEHADLPADGKIHADNTDGYGFLENLRQGAPGLAGRCRALHGAGRGRRGAGGRRVASRGGGGGDPADEPDPRNRARRCGPSSEPRSSSTTGCRPATPSRAPRPSSTPPRSAWWGRTEFRVPLDGLSPDAVVTDLVYTPLDTRLPRPGARDRMPHRRRSRHAAASGRAGLRALVRRASRGRRGAARRRPLAA
jgi:hypothetical protein